ncbi:MAG: AbgT family transporter, partial [Thermomicrobiales bacterium]|nr:AbgT family transporter [Thermomicrobiales bacterium]
PAAGSGSGGMQKVLDWIEEVGNKVPNPVLMFGYLILGNWAVSTLLAFFDVGVTETIAVPVEQGADVSYYEDTPAYYPSGEVDYELVETRVEINPLLSIDGIRFIFSRFVSNFTGFTVVGVTFVAMMGAGLAENAGLMNALIRKLVATAPSGLITFLIVLVGSLSSVASDAGYLILIPLAGVAFMVLGRNPIAGLTAGFAGVAATFAVNIIPQPTDAMLAEIGNESITPLGLPAMTILNNYYFGVVSMLVLCVVASVICEKVVEPRLGPWDRSQAGDASEPEAEMTGAEKAAEAKGLRYSLFGLIGTTILVVLLTAPSGAPLRDPVTGDILGTTPFMDSLLFIIALFFLVCGIAFGVGAGTIKKADDVIGMIGKTFNTLGGLILMFLMISQFVAHFNYSNLPPLIATWLADLLERAGLGAIPLLVGFIIVIIMLDFILPGASPKWAIFAPIFIPVFFNLGVAPQTLMAAYRIGDSPVNTLTPLMVYFPFIVATAQRYRKDVGIGTVISLMIPYAVVMAVVWIILFVIWFALGIPWGPGYPTNL